LVTLASRRPARHYHADWANSLSGADATIYWKLSTRSTKPPHRAQHRQSAILHFPRRLKWKLISSRYRILSTRVRAGVLRLAALRPTASYLARTEVHAFGFAIAASVLLSLFPLLNVMASIALYAFNWRAAVTAIQSFIKDYFPGELGNILASYFYNPNKIEAVSIVLLLFTANGIFEPLEVALNRAGGVTKDRSYVKNQLLSFLLILLCGGLVLASFLLTTMNREYASKHLAAEGFFYHWISFGIVRAIGIPMIMLALFLTYWLLPNCRVPVTRIIPVAFYVGLALTGLQYIAILAWKWIIEKMRHDYGPFAHSASVIFFSFIAAMIVLAGAEWCARRSAAAKPEEAPIMSANPTPGQPIK
jgi:membrane protein